ncbi:MAG: ATP-binding cassette domain-containing protein [Clostridiales Family XIII bacterium]|jgi:ABC-2 type transport system ATP-binding protein|nr:ATP-binding cassette domain-containing protein [Clostridiales Family XIII bacterium]
MEIVIENLSKNYGQTCALNDVSLRIGSGVFGLLGRNGAGKTTLLRTLATLLRPSAGSVSVCGANISEIQRIRGMIGYLPQDFAFYPGMRVKAALDYMGALSGMSRSLQDERVPLVLKAVNLYDVQKKRVRSLSGGMLKRLGVAQAILHDPKVLIVDEPTAGLDPLERLRFRELLLSFAEDRVVILSTHIVEDIEKACDSVAILEGGKVAYSGSVADFKEKGVDIEDAYMRVLAEGNGGETEPCAREL